MNSNGNPSPSINSQYSREEFKREFQQKSKELWNTMPLLISVIVSTKIILYITSWATSFLNNLICVHPSKTLFSFQLWRLLTAPLATDGLFDLIVVMTFYTIKIISPNEYMKGTARTLVEFMLNSAYYVFVMSVFAMPLGPSEYYICGLFPLNVAHICTQLFQEREKEYDMFIMKISAINLIYVILAFVWLFMGQPISSVVAVAALAYFNPLNKLGEERIQYLTLKMETIIAKVPRSINDEQANLNSKMDSDSLEPFDRNKIRGRVSQQIRPQSSQSTGSSSTRPSSSASNSSTGSGIQLGGERPRDNSNLLNMSNTETTPNSENFQEELQDIKFDV